MEVFADASHTVHDDAKGRRRAIAHIGKASVHASSTEQKVKLRTFFKAEMNSLHEATSQ